MENKPNILIKDRTIKEYTIPDNIPVYEKSEDVYNIKNSDYISIKERTFEGYTIPDNIPVYEKPEDVYQVPDNIPVIENTETKVPKNTISEEELDIWKQVEEEYDESNFLVKEGDVVSYINKEKLFGWLKEKLSGISFCQTYLTDKVDGDNGIVKENATLMLETEKGSKFFLNKAGKYHRLDGPAIEWMYGAKEYYKNGLRHRIGGPAYESKDEKQFWFEGKQYMESEYWIVSQEIENLK